MKLQLNLLLQNFEQIFQDNHLFVTVSTIELKFNLSFL